MKNKIYSIAAITIVLLHAPIYTNERKFKHVKGAYDFDGIEFLTAISHSCKSNALKHEIWALMHEQYKQRNYSNSANCSVETIQKNIQQQAKYYGYSAIKDLENDINSLVSRLNAQISSSIDWQPYLTGSFVDKEGNTLLHKLAERCNQDNTQDLTVLIQEINKILGPNGTIPTNFDNINGSKTNGQPVFAKGIGSFWGERLSPSFKNNNGQTPLDILEKKLDDNTYFGIFLASSCIPCKDFKQELQNLKQKEEHTQSITQAILKGKKIDSHNHAFDNNNLNELNGIKQQLEKEESDALKELAHTFGLSNEQYHIFLEIVEQERKFVFDNIAHYHPQIYGDKDHSPGFPIEKAQTVCQRNNMHINNITLDVYKDDYANNTTGGCNAFATTSYQARSPYINDQGQYVYPDSYVNKLNIDIYPPFFSLSPEQQEAIIIHELEHHERLHCFKKKILTTFLEHVHNKSKSDLFASAEFKKYNKKEEQSVDIIPAVKNAEVATLLAGICKSNQNKLFSEQECALLKRIDELHKKQ